MILSRAYAHKSLSDFKSSDLKDSELIESIKLSVSANLHSGTLQASSSEEINLNVLVHWWLVLNIMVSIYFAREEGT